MILPSCSTGESYEDKFGYAFEESLMKLSVVCAGIGGRGVLLASTILIEAAIKAGHHAIASDEYGMSQRGGSVVSLVKIGDFASPLIGSENADILLAFEESEFYRNLHFLKKGGVAIINTNKSEMPAPVVRALDQRNTNVYLVDSDAVARRKGMVQASNMALLGFFSALDLGCYDSRTIKETIVEKVSKKFLDKNLEIFDEGFNAARSLMKRAGPVLK